MDINCELNSTIALDDDAGALVILDQTRLPNERVELYLTKQNEIWEAIKSLRVRGAPAIGVAAAIGYYLAARYAKAESYEALKKELSAAKEYLASSRPTAVNLFWALDRMESVVNGHPGQAVSEIVTLLRHEAVKIRKEDIENCKKIGENGLALLSPGMGILTHCNAGRLAAVEYGTATAPIYVGQEQGYQFRVYADETRPLLQGARLTAYELSEAGIDVTLLCDNMASYAMKNGMIDAVLVGCDRVAANGDTANKIGTSSVAILAKYYDIPFYVCAPLATIDMACPDGAKIPVEQREPSEVTELWYERPMAPRDVKVLNPAFDVTDHTLVTAFITERGVICPPFANSLRAIFQQAQ